MRLLQALRPAVPEARKQTILAALRWPIPGAGPGAGRRPKATSRLAALDLRPVTAGLALPSDPASGDNADASPVRSRSGRTIRRDEDGRRWERVFDAPKDRRPLSPHEAVQRFAQWLRDEGYDGWLSAAEVLGFYRWWAEAAAIEEMCPEQLWERLASAPGVGRRRQRIVSTQDPSMVMLRQRLERQPEGSKDRPTIYRIYSDGEMEEAAREAAKATRGRSGKPDRAQPRSISETRRCAA